jgi:16S rRNA G966 N2-methylase RsmD
MEHIEHIERNMPAEAHTPMYNWHKFWARKTWNVVGQYIDNYCPKSGIVLDPFSGSGVTVIEALRRGHRVIAIDLIPVGNNILRATVAPVKSLKLRNALLRVQQKVRDNILELYQTECRACGKQIVFDCMIWENEKANEVRYKCTHCGDRQEQGCRLSVSDKQRLEEIKQVNIELPYPRNDLYHSNGKPFKEKQKYESLDEIFTHRNLLALAILRNAIEQETDLELQFMLKMAFTSMVHLCSRMMPVRPSRPFSSVWNEHSYWYASKYMEQNVWREFESSVIGKQGLLAAKAESNEVLKDVRFAKTLNQIIDGAANIFIVTGNSLDFMKEIPERSIDYIFTDPPYNSSVQYGELAYLWVAWFGNADDYVDSLKDEVIHNERQDKDFDTYYRMLSTAFKEMFRVLRDDSYLTVTFHNPATKVRNATIRAGIFAGFDFEKIHWQELARPSAKSLLQPFGSATGDFYLRFHKPPLGIKVTTPTEIDEARFERIVVETTKELLAERGEPTPYTIIINYIDPVLAKHGYFLALHTGLDVKTVLKNHLDHEFILVPGTIGSAEGELWWFKETSIIPHFEIPLSERVEQTVLRKLMSEYKVTFTQLWEAVSIEFPNALTSDSVSLMDILQEYAKKESGGFWILKPIVRQRQTEHAQIISILADIGDRSGFKTWIGLREQKTIVKGVAGATTPLIEFCRPKKLELAGLIQEQLDDVVNIDLLWYKEGTIHALFEVENTTAMTEALRRASCVPYHTAKYMVLPDERANQLTKKMKSPMFGQQFERDKWQVLYYDTLYSNERYLKQGKKQIDDVVGIRVGQRPRKTESTKQLGLF